MDYFSKKKLAKSEDAVKNLEILVGHFFRSERLKEHFNKGFSTLTSVGSKK